MHATFIRGAAAALSIAILAACDRGPAEPTAAAKPSADVFRHTHEYVQDLTDHTVQIGCADGGGSEVVRLRGSIVERFTNIQLPNGTVKSHLDERPEGLGGTGLTTGQEYDVLYRLQTHDFYADRGAGGSFKEQWELKNRATGSVYGLTYILRWKMDADRNIVVNREQERPVCR